METNVYFYSKRRMMKKIVFGLLVISAGLLLLAFNTGRLPIEYKHIVFSWQMLLIAIGVINIWGRDSWIPGIILIGVGGFFLIPELYFIPYDPRMLFWPAMLILAGLLIIFHFVFRKKRHAYFTKIHHKFHHQVNTQRLDAGYIEETNIFAGGKKKIQPCEFKGGKISNVFGGLELDLTMTTLAEGENVLELSNIFGGAVIIVPGDWEIHNEVTAVLGGFVDKRQNIPTTGSTRKLIIRGTAIFGGGEIKNYF